eukprot:s633_g7.t1
MCSLNSLRAAPLDICGAKNVQVVNLVVGRQNAFATGRFEFNSLREESTQIRAMTSVIESQYDKKIKVITAAGEANYTLITKTAKVLLFAVCRSSTRALVLPHVPEPCLAREYEPMQILKKICSVTLGLHSFLAVCACSGVLEIDSELLALLVGSQLPVAAQLLQKDPVLWLLNNWALWPAAILGYVMSYGDSPAEQIIGVMAVHVGGGCSLVAGATSPAKHPWKLWPMALLALVISCYAAITPIHQWDSQLLNLCAAWLVTTVTLLLVSELLRSHLECQQELENQRDYNQILLQSLPFSQVATCCLRGCPSLFNVTADSDLQMNLMSANNPVVVRSSPEFDALFGRHMMGLSLDKAWVAHHLGRQQLKGIFCQDKPKEELNITFVDADGNLFECRVLFPKEVATARSDPPSRTSRELVVGLCLVGSKRPRLDRDLTNAMVKSKSLPERKSPQRSTGSTGSTGSGIVRLSKLARQSPRRSLKVSHQSDQSAPAVQVESFENEAFESS